MSTAKKTPTALPVQYRVAVIEGERKDGERLSGPDPGRFSFSLSSEEPVRRWFGNEVLKHDKANVRTQRLDDGMVPALFNHDIDKQLGAVDKYSLKAGRLIVSGSFSRSAFAQEKRQDYDDGILKAASVGYKVHKMVRTEDEDNPNAPDQCDITDWEPFDASLVTVPADATVGVGRAEAADTDFPVEIETISRRSDKPAAQPAIEVITEERKDMAEPAVVPSAEAIELKRINEILAVSADKDWSKHVSVEETRKAIEDKTTADAFKDMVIRKIVAANEVGKVGTAGDNAFSEASRKDQKGYSFINVLRSLVNQARQGTFKNVPETKFEREMSEEIGKRIGKSTTGFFVPLTALTRALGTQTVAAGAGQIALTSEAAAVETITRPDMIELLRHRPRVQALGARVLGGLQGIVRLPRQSSAGSWQWLGEGASVTPSDLTMDFVSVQPRRGSTQSAVDIELLASASPDVEGLMRADFNKVRALAIDYAALNGPTGGPGPQGLFNTTGLALISPSGTAFSDGGQPLTYQDWIKFETLVAQADADVATSGWMVTPGIRGQAKGTPKFPAGLAEPIWKEGPHDPSGLEEGPLGYKAGVTNQLLQNLTHAGVTGSILHQMIFGDWSQVVLADWGAVEVIYDPYTQAGNGAIVLTMRSLHDVAVRHIAAFAGSLTVAIA
jgi:HK97 family phage major capsid protein